jgi:RNA polymerase sigma factor (sigma-70 family)
MRPTVYVIDDDTGVLSMLRAVIDTIDVEVRTFSSAGEFFADHRPQKAEQCLICDVRMPGMGGLDVQKQLSRQGETLPIIFISGYAEVGTAVEAMRDGAFDFLEKPFSPQTLLDKIQRALTRSQVMWTEKRHREAIDARRALLTPKEQVVVAHVVEGLSSREIAKRLGMSYRTVENHRARILEKLHVTSTVELVKLFL